MQRFTSWAQIAPTATEAELELMTCVTQNRPCVLAARRDEIPVSFGKLPDTELAKRRIRASVLRFFLVEGKTQHLTEKGITLVGAYIHAEQGDIDLQNCKDLPNLTLEECCFSNRIRAEQSQWRADLRIVRCKLPQFDGSGLQVESQVDFDGSHFRTKNPNAIDLQNAKIGHGLLLRHCDFSGTVHLTNAQIGGELNFQKAQFLNPNKGTQHTDKFVALDLTDAKVTTSFYFNYISQIEGVLDFSNLSVATFDDTGTRCPHDVPYILQGFTYQLISGETQAKLRLHQLARQHRLRVGKKKLYYNERHFYPQPYRQLASTLQKMGHEHEAREVSYELAKQLENHRLKSLKKETKTLLKDAPRPGKTIGLCLLTCWRLIWEFLFRLIVGYGWRPFRSIGFLAGLIILCWILTLGAWSTGDFGPNSAPILLSDDWKMASEVFNPAAAWSDSIAAKDWQTFHSLAYAADVVIPIIDFGQTDAWAPSTERGPWGFHLWWTSWFFTAFGWIVSTLGATALTGIIRRE